MHRAAVTLATAALVALAAREGAAFNPLPRPVPTGVSGVCAVDASTACEADSDCASGTCVADPADLVPGVGVRGTLTLISDEDVTSWNAGQDDSANRNDRARLTLLLQYERAGALRTFAEVYDLSAEICAFQTEPPTEGPRLCVPQPVTGWFQPASEAVITEDGSVDTQGPPHVVFSIPGAQVAKAIAVDLTGNSSTTATPFLEIVDRLPETTSNHADPATGRDPLASVQQFKVTIRLRP
jgi:hypothetical protein